ncbi:MAG: phosphoribosyl 1,2-cyclic phosphate phosphodiesterase [Cognaticolwellia sp.]|jgi:phosphoribosyl 1,2-cyclic phosphate phosphodiesterase
MKITFLGTGTSQGVPIIGCKCEACLSTDKRDKRLRCAIMITLDDGRNIVIDIGPDFRYQMLREGVEDIEAILITHEHNDHMVGLDDVRPINFLQRKDMPVYALERVIKNLKERFAYIFSTNPYPGIPRIKLLPIHKSNPFEVAGQHIIPIEVMHYKLSVLGFRFGDFTYLTDIKTISDEELEKVKGTKILVLGALQRQEHISHLTIDEAITLSQKIQPEQCYFTHMSHRLGKHADVIKTLPKNITLAYDGLILNL